jgi:hypothetical protein
MWACLDVDVTIDFLFSSARLAFHKEIMLEEGKVGVDGEIALAQMNENDNLNNRIRIEMD